MGSRIGYCVEQDGQRSGIVRKQWASSIETGVIKMWKFLGGTEDIGSGSHALRDDLNIGRAFGSMCVSFIEEGFHSIEKDVNCDISDNGLIIVDISQWDGWKIYHLDVSFDDKESFHKTLIAVMNKEGFEWQLEEMELENLGEGLS